MGIWGVGAVFIDKGVSSMNKKSSTKGRFWRPGTSREKGLKKHQNQEKRSIL